jgi:hypothetical protein
MPLEIVIDRLINGCQYRACSVVPQDERTARLSYAPSRELSSIDDMRKSQV